MPPTEPVEVFISYAQEDESLCAELEKHLKTLQRLNAIADLVCWINEVRRTLFLFIPILT